MRVERKLTKPKNDTITYFSQLINDIGNGQTPVDVEGQLLLTEGDLKKFKSPNIEFPFGINAPDGIKAQLTTIGTTPSFRVYGDLRCTQSIDAENCAITVNDELVAHNVKAAYINVKGDMRCGDIEAFSVYVEKDLSCGLINTTGGLHVRGDVTCGHITVQGIIDVRGNLTCHQIKGESKHITVRGDLICWSIDSNCDLHVNGDASCNGDIISGPITVKGDLYCGGDIILQGDLIVKGKLTCEGTIDAGAYKIIAGSYECPYGTGGIINSSYVRIG